MTAFDCAHRGHHWHEDDRAVFARRKPRSGRERPTTVTVHCCHCGTEALLLGYVDARSQLAPFPSCGDAL